MILTVSQLNEYVSGVLSHDPILRDISVEGEISGFKRHSSGHLYFSLKDEAALIRCVMFKQAAFGLSFRPADGMKVTVGGYASLYTRDGQFQLYAKTMRKQGEGELFAQFLKLKSKLEGEGYFDPARKRPIPFLPQCVGVITSKTGAVLHDITQIIRRRFPAMNIQVCPVPVQGAGASRDIANGIRRMNERNEASVLIIARGGGSMEDLWAFNEPELAEAIFKSSIPVISAVGHETDYTIADFTADLRAPTPSAAAELCVPEYDALLMRLAELSRRLSQASLSGLGLRRERLSSLARGLLAASHNIRLNSQILDSKRIRLRECAQAGIKNKRFELEKLILRLDARSPQNLLESGYALILDADGGLVTSAASLNKGGEYNLSMRDGSAKAVVTEISLNEMEQI